MPCYHPIPGWRAREVNKATGKRSIVFSEKDGLGSQPVSIPCGQCVGCRLERSRQWAIRCVHESALYQHNSFITLTYNNEHLPQSGSLDKGAYQKFMKRLRQSVLDNPDCYLGGPNVRFFACGEYGEKFARPHYHACLFNVDFADKKHWSTRDGIKLYRSDSLEKLWPFGFSTIGEVNFDSAAYVARYVMKKITGERALGHYTDFNRSTGEIYAEVIPEFTLMSRRPGLGREWFEKYSSDVYPHDRVVLRGKELKPPKYYDNIFDVDHHNEMCSVKESRRRQVVKNASNATWQRLEVREEIHSRKCQLLKRGYENDF